MLISLIKFVVFSMFFTSISIFAGPFTFINDLEIGGGFGYNIDYWSLGSTKILPRARSAGGKGLQQQGETFRVAIELDLRTQGVFSNAVVKQTDFRGSGDALTMDGVNLDGQILYHIFPWLFARVGFTVDIPVPVEYSVGADYGIKAVSDGPDVASFSQQASYRVEGLDFEVPVMLGFNLVSLGQFSVYGVIGASFTFGGYRETFSASDTLNLTSEASDDMRAAFNSGNIGSKSYEKVINEYGAFQVGLHWLFGFKYKIKKTISIFAEMKWLNSASLLTIQGTQELTEGGEGVSNADAAHRGTLLGQALNDAGTSNETRVRTLGSGARAVAANASVAGTLTRTYQARWVVGVTYGIDL